ncbi:ABC transporter permease [Epidermidibacterium keratini]|uniref:ABC transporter permease n=1 Tax=Epidermidibacterium keratini TaxID=1891644 RepID=UPI001CEF9893|nr:ABC transporter permease [Epidermidibacterium keratini]
MEPSASGQSAADPATTPQRSPDTDEDVVRAPGTKRFLRRFRSNKLAVAALIVLSIIVLASAFAPLIAPYAPEQIDVLNRLSGSTPEHILGTDALGRDTFSRLLYAGRISLLAAATAVGIAMAIGIPAGLIAGYFGGAVDWLASRIADILMTFPAVLLAMAIIAARGPGLTTAMVALGIVYAPRLFRVVRSSALAVRAETYVEASISIGSSAGRIIRTRILPNILSPLLVQISLLLAAALLAEAALSLLGLGVVPPTPSWGNMLGRGFEDIRKAPLLVVYPGIAIALTTISFNLIGDGLRDSFGRETRKGK